MKKVLVLVTAMLLVASAAMASSVILSKHNLQSTFMTGSNDEVCVFCHTPHRADITVANAPLWNRTNTDPTNYYNSLSLSAASKPGLVSSSILNSDAPLCLSCHDGASLTDPLVNPPNQGTVTWAATAMNANANIGTALNNDHPIGMVYADVNTAKNTSFVDTPTSGINARLKGGVMWCSTCHNVHDDAYYPFLATSNSGSDLCLDCHIK